MQFNLVVVTILCSFAMPIFAISKEEMIAVFDMETTTPSIAVLKGRLERSGFKELNDVTHLSVRLADQKLSLLRISEHVEGATHTYYMYKRNPSSRSYLEGRQQALFGAILEHDPKVFEALKKCGLFPVPAPEARK